MAPFLGEIIKVTEKNGVLGHPFYRTSWKFLKRMRTQKNGIRSFKRVLATLVESLRFADSLIYIVQMDFVECFHF